MHGSPTKVNISNSLVNDNLQKSGISSKFDEEIQPKPQYLGEVLYSELEFGDSLGVGSFGEVFSGKAQGQRCAIKRIFMGKNQAERSEIIFDFNKEISILSKLDHERIVKFIGVASRKALRPSFSPEYYVPGTPNQPTPKITAQTPFAGDDGERRCILLESCEGSVASLLKLVRRKKCAVTWRICLTIAKDAAEAVAYLHGMNPPIIHRDLKAENFLLTSNFRCKLTDFGLSRPLPTTSSKSSRNIKDSSALQTDTKHIQPEQESSRKAVMTVCGTPCWVAPEIFRNEPYNEKVDVYSFGIVLWELFTGKKPHSDRECSTLPYLVGRKGLRPPLLPHCPDSLNDLMRQCWHESDHLRPSFNEILISLDNIEKEIASANKLQHSAHELDMPWPKPLAKLISSPRKLAEPRPKSVARGGMDTANSSNNNQNISNENYIYSKTPNAIAKKGIVTTPSTMQKNRKSVNYPSATKNQDGQYQPPKLVVINPNAGLWETGDVAVI